jgi:hypothetical protein
MLEATGKLPTSLKRKTEGQLSSFFAKMKQVCFPNTLNKSTIDHFRATGNRRGI